MVLHSSHQQRLVFPQIQNPKAEPCVYQPTIWSHDYIQSLDDKLPMSLKVKVSELEKKVMLLMDGGFTSTLELLQHIDDIERLGLGYRFRNHIRRVLTSIYGINNGTAGGLEDSTLHEASLRFRILRQHGHNNVSQDFLRRFSDSLIGRVHETDVKGMVSLYEASHLAFMEESDLHEAKLFATEHLGKLRTKLQGEEYEDIINHALETPLYHAMLRLEARHYIDRYTKQQHANPLLLELATLDFNMLQAEFKKELKKVSTWWKSIGLAHKLGFARDRLVECFFWTVGMVFEPQYHSCRVGLTKVGTLITVIDDIYDVYGCLDELEVFTNAVRRWDINAMEHMPKCLQVAFEALHNTVTDMGSNTLIGQDITPILTKVVMAYVLVAAIGAAAQSAAFGKLGEAELEWLKVCDMYGKFCKQVGEGIASSVFVCASMLIVSAISAFSLFRLYGAGNKAW